MKLVSTIIIATLWSILAPSVYAQGAKFNADQRKIIELTDKRTGTEEIAGYLKSSDVQTAYRAAIGLANIRDTTARKALVARLEKETRPLVTDAIAFALGVLGPNPKVFAALSDKASNTFSDEIALALARTTSKETAPAFVTMLATQCKTNDPKSARAVSVALSELGLRRLITDDAVELIHQLEARPDSSTRWHAIYSLARSTDSAMLLRHIDLIHDYLTDLGSPDCRMFAATALGNIHDNSSAAMLLRAARSETEWRVRVNLFNALSHQPYFSSGMLEVARDAVLEATNDTPSTIHPALAALRMIDNMLGAGKYSSADSVSVREFLTTFTPASNTYDDRPVSVRATAMIPAARFGGECIPLREMVGMYSYHNRAVTDLISEAVGHYRDTASMFILLRRLLSVGASEAIPCLQGLQEQWDLAVSDTNYWKTLDSFAYIPSYRHLVIRFADNSDLTAITGVTMEMIKEPHVVVDSFKQEAWTYLLKYVKNFNNPMHAEHLMAVLDAIGTLKPPSSEFRDAIESVYKNAATIWGNPHVAEAARQTLDSLGVKNIPVLKVITLRDSIDWAALENAPDTLLVPTKYGFLFLRLRPEDAPLTVIHMLKLARQSFFVNNYFHRVVPNFVIQTGDITGTGWGRPGETIRTEISPARYDAEGVVGMASSGKDTEGSQWFVTHCPTPHLDTHYTIWGNIVKNIDNIDKIQLDDQVENVIPYK